MCFSKNSIDCNSFTILELESKRCVEKVNLKDSRYNYKIQSLYFDSFPSNLFGYGNLKIDGFCSRNFIKNVSYKTFNIFSCTCEHVYKNHRDT